MSLCVGGKARDIRFQDIEIHNDSGDVVTRDPIRVAESFSATTKTGDRSSIAILMRKYGMPHRTETRRKSSQARRFTPRPSRSMVVSGSGDLLMPC